MAVNPMQRKARNSFLLGMIVSLLITGIIIVILFLQLKKVKDEQAAEAKLRVNVYTLNQDVKSGQVLTEDMFSIQATTKTTIPSNATSVAGVIDTWFLQTSDGEKISRIGDYLYLQKADSIVEVYSDGNGGYFKLVDGEKVSITSKTRPIEDDDGWFIRAENNSDNVTRVYEGDAGNYYIYKLDNSSMSTSDSVKRTKVELTLKNVPVLAKVDMNQNTVITPNLVMQSDARVTDDVRIQEYNMIVLPVDLATDDYVDIRLMTPGGQDFIVVSKAQVEVPINEDGTYISDTIRMDLREDEILSLSSAIVEAYGIKGAKLYATKYKEPGLQKASTPTYTPNNAVTAQINANPNIVEKAMKELAARYAQSAKDLRNQYLQPGINNDQSYDANVQTGMDQDITNASATRKKYLETLQ